VSLVDTLRSLLPELSRTGSTEAVFGRPIEAGDVVIIPVARMTVGFLGFGGQAQGGFGGTAQVDPVALIVVKDREVSLVHFRTWPDARARRWAGPAAAGAGRGPLGRHPPPDLPLPFSLDAVVIAVRDLVREINRGTSAPRGGGGEGAGRSRRGRRRNERGAHAAPDGTPSLAPGQVEAVKGVVDADDEPPRVRPGLEELHQEDPVGAGVELDDGEPAPGRPR